MHAIHVYNDQTLGELLISLFALFLGEKFISTDLPSVGSIMTFPDSLNFPITPKLPSCIFIRECYPALSDKILDVLQSRRESSESASTLVIVCGTSGIGKSCFLSYLLLYFINNSVGVCFQHSKDTVYYCSSVRQCTVISVSDVTAGTVFLSDMDVSGTALRINKKLCHCFAIVASSMDRDSRKVKKFFRNPLQCFMPTWTYDEIKRCHEIVYQKLVTSDEVEKRYKRWGGIPRIVFSFKDTYSFYEAELSFYLKDPKVVVGLLDRNSYKHFLDPDSDKAAQILSHDS